jgi:hypothetical protein
MIALETWRDQNSEAYFVTDSVIMDRFRPGWVYDTSDVEPFKANYRIGPDAQVGSQEARSHHQRVQCRRQRQAV